MSQNHLRSFDESDNVSAIHGPIVPAEVREGDMISAKLTAVGGSTPFQKALKVWRMSPLGVELVDTESDPIPKGTSVDLELQVGSHRSVLNGLIVDEVVEKSNRRFIHIRLVPRTKERVESIERRSSNRWMCSDEFFPTAVASNPARFNDFVYFKIRDISVGGLKLHTSLRNKFVVPGMVFECIVNFPMISQIKMRLEIKSARIELLSGKEVLALGATFDHSKKEISEAVGQYLIQFGSVTNLLDLRSQGLSVTSVSNAVHFSYVRTKEEYEEVLELRYDTYKVAGKLKQGAKVIDMADEFDSRARIVIGKFKGKVVATARLIFNQFEDTMEQERFVSWPKDLPRRDEMVEIMRACTDTRFRRSDLLISMFRFIAVTVAQSKRKWIIICATDDMMPLYEKIGFHQVNLAYNHAGLNNLRHNILLANVPDAMEGKTVGPVTWNIVWSDVSRYLEQYGVLQPDPLTNIRLALYRLIGPFCKLVYNFKKMSKPKVRIKEGSPAMT